MTTRSTPSDSAGDSLWTKTLKIAGLTYDADKNTHKAFHVEKERAHELVNLTRELAAVDRLPLPAASRPVDQIQVDLNADAARTTIETLEDANGDFASDPDAYRGDILRVLRLIAGQALWQNRARSETTSMPTIADACTTLVPRVSAATGYRVEGRPLAIDVSAEIAAVIGRMRNMRGPAGGYLRTSTADTVTSASPEGQRLTGFRTNASATLNAIHSSRYWRAADIPNGTAVVQAADRAIQALNNYVRINSTNVERGTAAEMRALNEALEALVREINAAAEPPHGIDLREKASGYTISRWARAGVAAVLAALPIAEVTSPVKPARYVARHTIGRVIDSESFLNPYHNYTMPELEARWLAEAGAKGERIEKGEADTGYLGQLEYRMAELAMERAAVSNPVVKKAVDAKIKELKGEAETPPQAPSGDPDFNAQANLFEAGAPFDVRAVRKGDTIALKFSGDLTPADFAIGVAGPGEPNWAPLASNAFQAKNGYFVATLPNALAQQPVIEIAVSGIDKGGKEHKTNIVPLGK